MIFLALPAIATLCLVCSIVASMRAGRHETDRDSATRNATSIQLALWAIAILLLWIGLR